MDEIRSGENPPLGADNPSPPKTGKSDKPD